MEKKKKKRLEEAEAGIKIPRANSNSLRYAKDTTLKAESKEELKNLLLKVKQKSEKAGLKLNIKKTVIMASCSIIPWQIEGEKMKTVMDLIFLGFRITTDDDCSYGIKRCLLLGRKAMMNLDSVLKSRDTILSTKLHIGKVFPLVMYECEGWTLKEVEC